MSTSIELRLVSREDLFLDAKIALNCIELENPRAFENSQTRLTQIEFLPRWD